MCRRCQIRSHKPIARKTSDSLGGTDLLLHVHAGDVGIFQSVPGYGANDSRAVRNLGRWISRLSFGVAGFEETGDWSGARRLDKNSFVAREPSLRCENFFVSHNVDGAARLLHGTFRAVPARRISNANGGCNRLRFLDNSCREKPAPRPLPGIQSSRVTASIFRARGMRGIRPSRR